MIVLSNTTAQTLNPGQSMLFDRVVTKCGCNQCYRNGTGSVKIRHQGSYLVAFSGNLGSTAAGTVQLNIQLGGVNLPETTIISQVTAADTFNHESTVTGVDVCCCDFDRLTVANTGTTPIIIDANSAFVVK